MWYVKHDPRWGDESIVGSYDTLEEARLAAKQLATDYANRDGYEFHRICDDRYEYSYDTGFEVIPGREL